MIQKTKKNSIVFLVIILLAIFTLGIIVGKLINLSYFTIEKEINLIDLLSICVTLFVAWYISWVLETKKQDNRIEKDLIIQRTESIYQLIDDSSQKVVSGSIPFNEATSHIKRINVSITSINKLLKITELSCDGNYCVQLLASTKKLNQLLTSTPVIDPLEVQNSNLPITVANGIIHLTRERIHEIEKEYDNLKNKMLHFQISINKASKN